MAVISVGIMSGNEILLSQLERLIERASGLSVHKSHTIQLNGRNHIHDDGKPTCDVLVLVLRIPITDDLALLRQLRELHPNLHIITVSTLEPTDYQDIVLAAGAARIISEEALFHHLTPTIFEVMRKNEEG